MITVSVSVSMAVSPITGAASFRRTRSMSDVSRPIFAMASFRAFFTECTFSVVPFVPVVGQEALVRNVRFPLSVTSPTQTSVVEFPISTPAI